MLSAKKTDNLIIENNKNKKFKLIILVPIFNDWEALYQLLLQIDQINLSSEIELNILVIDDFSSEEIPINSYQEKYQKINQFNILKLRRNLGHQRAITIGLCYVYKHLECDAVVVMDGDGEDNPFEIETLFNVSANFNHQKIIFAKRSKRSETTTFRLFYYLYQQIYKLLIGKEMRVGNFSLIPAKLLKNIVVISEIWNHYSSGILRSKIAYVEVNIPRAKRLAGQPKMNFVSLITHGLSSISVYGDIVGTRGLIGISLMLLLLTIIFILVVIIKFFTDWEIPGWATYVSGLIWISGLQMVLIGTIFSIMTLSSRNSFYFLPIRDYKYYIDELINIKL